MSTDDKTVRQRILEQLELAGEPLADFEVANRLELSFMAMRSQLNEMARAKTVGRRREGDHYVYYAFKDEVSPVQALRLSMSAVGCSRIVVGV